MFEIGSDYNITMLETSENYEGKVGAYETSNVYEVVEVDGTLVKLLGPDYSKPEFADILAPGTDRSAPRKETILNTSSLFFVRAEKIPD